jgi:hypothetical protein
MFDTALVTAKLRKVIGWKNFWNLTEIPALGATLNTSESGQYYQDFNGALRLDYINSLLPPSDTLTAYLDRVVTEAIPTLLNKIETEKQLHNQGRDLTTSDVIYSVGNKTTNIVNEGRFCGVMFRVVDSVGISTVINRIGLYLTSSVTNLDLYLFHSSQEQKIATYQFTTTSNNSFSYIEQRVVMNYDNGSINGGTWYLGYYQSDLVAQSTQAVSYQAMNFLNGGCSGCGQAEHYNLYQKLIQNVSIMGFYVPSASLPVSKDERFDNQVAVMTNTNNWGFNFNITIGCDMTQFWIDNRRLLANALGQQVAMSVLSNMKFSSEINNVEESVKIMIIRDLEGTSDTGQQPLWKNLEKSIKALILDNGNMNSQCLPCARKPATRIGAAT